MKYMCLLYGDESTATPPDSPEFMEVMKAYQAFGEEAGAAGVIVAGEALEDSHTATKVQVRNGETITTDGPYAETKEQVGGFYVLECDTLDEALKWAAKIPAAQDGIVEVRPCPNFG